MKISKRLYALFFSYYSLLAHPKALMLTSKFNAMISIRIPIKLAVWKLASGKNSPSSCARMPRPDSNGPKWWRSVIWISWSRSLTSTSVPLRKMSPFPQEPRAVNCGSLKPSRVEQASFPSNTAGVGKAVRRAYSCIFISSFICRITTHLLKKTQDMSIESLIMIANPNS
jgi:hypothetical protein